MIKILGVMGAILCVASSQTMARVKVVYGQDNRKEVFEVKQSIQDLAKATAGMISNRSLINFANGKSVLLPLISLKRSTNLCPEERFGKQNASMDCSGFLVAPDLLVTAGHCISTQVECDRVSWIFDYKVREATGRSNNVIPKKDVFRCKKVVDAKFYSQGQVQEDYSLVQLDRVVKNRPYLNYRTDKEVSLNQEVFVIGHPSGLPTKVAEKAKVLRNYNPHFFSTNLDTFGGNSGSAVFNAETHRVEGILVRGAKDYVLDKRRRCRKVNRVSERIGDNRNLGESVSRISEIRSLKYRWAFLDAVKDRKNFLAKFLLSQIPHKEITDNYANSALHVAVMAADLEMVKFLVGQGLNLDHKNLDGETPFNMAVKLDFIDIADYLFYTKREQDTLYKQVENVLEKYSK